jgi:uncharacterized membrane protein HdeD (DUF308 family)
MSTTKIDLPIQLPQKYVKWSLIASLLVFVCGILAIILPLTFSLGIAVFLGCVVLVAGLAHAVFAFQTQHMGGFLGHILLFALYELAAICLLANPLLSIFSLAIMLAVFLILEGILELALYFRLRRFRHSSWVLADGVGTLILGILIFSQWPSISIDTIGALIGISLALTAVSRVFLSLAVRGLRPISA